ncbi:hypothetical protein [Absidia glauca]|uniref:Uncharacterized protein n=1 Tax=Absidia glauca TaxID=4829 RepID=A0A168PCS4_ABSGL|nr:hypothetical protein [Absidia glauca]
MDAQYLLMKRLATASHDKIYPSVTPKCEVQLRRTLLTTRQQHLDNGRDISDDDWTWFTQTIQADDNDDDKPCDWLDHEDDGSDSPRKRSKSSLCTPAVLLRV